MARRTRSENEYRFKVSLKGAKRIWRLIAMRGDQTLDDLHEAMWLLPEGPQVYWRGRITEIAYEYS